MTTWHCSSNNPTTWRSDNGDLIRRMKSGEWEYRTTDMPRGFWLKERSRKTAIEEVEKLLNKTEKKV
jgi:hypothetical protein